MRVIGQSPDPLARMHTMTGKKVKSGTIDVKALLAGDEEFLRALVRTALEEVLEAEMTEALSAEKGERTAGRQGYRSGYYGRTLITRVGKLELRVPQDRSGRFSTELFERYQRSERALVAALAEMYVQGVSTRKVKAITEELCGHSFSASSISAMNQGVGQFEGAPEMRFDLTGRPQALHAGRRDPGGAGHRAATPPPQMGRRRHRLLHHLLHRRLRQPRLAPAPGTIAQPVQPVQRKAPDPPVHGETRDPQLLGDALLGQTLRAQQDDLSSPTITHRHCRRASATVQLLSLFRS